MKSERLILLLVIITIVFAYINSKRHTEKLSTSQTLSNENKPLQSIY
jgi:uncharacterized membrane protein YwzB